jgi:hypothetical protein
VRISQIRISNVLGIAELELSPKGYTQISGQNGTGKTSVLEAIKAALKEGHDATLLRKGAEQGEAVLVLDDGTEIIKTIKPGTSTTVVRDSDGKRMARPASVIQGLIDVLSVNPVAFLAASEKERVRVLLEAMPLKADPARLIEITGIDTKGVDGHALDVIETVRKQVYDDRTGTNRAVKEKEATISQLRQALPEAPGGIEGDEASLDADIAAAAAARDDKLGKIQAKLSGLERAHHDTVDAIRTKLQADIDALKAAAQLQVDQLSATLDENRQRAAAARDKANADHLVATGPKREALAAIRANRDAAAKRQGTLETIAQLEEHAEHLRADAERQTKALTDLDTYKGELLNNLPIPGLVVQDGQVMRDGVPFDRLNTAQQVSIAVELAKLRAGDLGIVCVDRIEALDKDSREALRKGALEAGLQLFVTRVTDDAFKINTAG